MIDELERRVRTVEEELNGEKHLTRYAVEQTLRNGEVLNALRSDVDGLRVTVDRLGGDMAAVKAALPMHGRALDVLQQDVRQIRSGQEELRRGQEELRARVEQLEAQTTARVDRLAAQTTVRFDRLEVDVNRKLDAILVAITPLSPG